MQLYQNESCLNDINSEDYKNHKSWTITTKLITALFVSRFWPKLGFLINSGYTQHKWDRLTVKIPIAHSVGRSPASEQTASYVSYL